MPRNALTKEELKVKVLGLIKQLGHENCNANSKLIAEKYLNEVLFTIEQYNR
jgi:hypothetical protein